MTKEEYISLIKNLLRKVDKTNKYHDVVVERAIEHAIKQVFSDIFRADPREIDNYTKTFGEDTAITVVQHPTTKIYYSTLPAPYVTMPDKASGVRHIFTIEEGEVAFVPMTKTEMDLAPNTYYGFLGGRIGYAVRNNKVEYWGMNTVVAAAGVRMDILIPFSAYDDNDEVNLPFGKDEDLQQLILTFLVAIQPVDLKDNNAEGQ